jgi:hypothetical protein
MSEILKQPKVLCWDLDRTIGLFDGLAYLDSPKSEVPRAYRSLLRRDSINTVLDRMSGNGFHHYLTTAATEDYAREAIKRASLE